jgi:polar amino acid transport system ATP-binding protein
MTELGDTVITLEGVDKAYGKLQVLHGIDFTVRAHEVVALIGPSGCGKSTLLKCINLLEPVQTGRVSVLGQELTDPRVDVDVVRRRIGIVFQSFNLFPHLSVLGNVTLAPRRVLGQSKASAESAARELLDRFGLADKADSYPDRLSGGQQQRVAIVRALAMEPEILLLDEVTAALDPVLVGEVLNVIREVRDLGMTMVLATHEMGFAREVADRVCFLKDGRICEQGPPSVLFTAPQHPDTQHFLRRVIEARRL